MGFSIFMVIQDEDLTLEEKEAKEIFLQHRGFWSHALDETLQLDPEFVSKYGKYSAYPGTILEPKLKELIHISIDVITTHEHSPRGHIRNAIEEGASVQEIMETIELAVCSGIESGLLAGVEKLHKLVGAPDHNSPEERKKEISGNKFENIFGYRADVWEKLLNLDTEAFEHTVSLFSHPWENGELSPKDKELINIANSVTSTHLSSIGTDIHIQAALDKGATPEEILAVIQTAACIGIHSATSFSTALIEEAQQKGLIEDLEPRSDDDELYSNR